MIESQGDGGDREKRQNLRSPFQENNALKNFFQLRVKNYRKSLLKIKVKLSLEMKKGYSIMSHKSVIYKYNLVGSINTQEFL